ncbi:MAG: class I SAM-dependent methyltransferase [Actinomycetia bacterium]|nr:class I SAM-dependent methyltransferase [Actinomycetes bacterium]
MPGDDIVDFYQSRYDESARLTQTKNQIEFLRTADVLSRFLPADPARILDVGGGTGVYAEWLAQRGHHVTLIDPVERHIEAVPRLDPGAGSISAEIGDARSLDRPDDSVDATLMLGPLYHLPDRSDRVTAWAQARRVCRPGGVVVAAVISRFASFHDMLIRNRLTETGIIDIVAADLTSGQHRNPDRIDGLFTTAYFHHPDEVAGEAEAAGLTIEHIIGVEGMAGFADDLHHQLDDDDVRQFVLGVLRDLEEDKSIIGVSNHILAVARA